MTIGIGPQWDGPERPEGMSPLVDALYFVAECVIVFVFIVGVITLLE